MNTLFSAVTNEEFKKISSIEIEKEAWTILQTTYEGTKAINDSKLQRLTTSFEEIKMEEDESFDEVYAKLKNIVNSAFNLGETIPKPKIVRKVLRSLLERFHAKITAIEESKDSYKIPLTELVGNLQTYELSFSRIGKLVYILSLISIYPESNCQKKKLNATKILPYQTKPPSRFFFGMQFS